MSPDLKYPFLWHRKLMKQEIVEQVLVLTRRRDKIEKIIAALSTSGWVEVGEIVVEQDMREAMISGLETMWARVNAEIEAL